MDLTVFEDTKQQAVLVEMMEEIARLKSRIAQLERETKWLKRHMPEPDLRYMG